MQRGVLIAVTNPSSPDREADYNRWYDEKHLPEVLAMPGIQSARRYRGLDLEIPEAVGGATLGMRNIAIYEMESEDLAETMQNVWRSVAEGEMELDDSLETDPAPGQQVFLQIAEQS
jgi:hypothetical protein